MWRQTLRFAQPCKSTVGSVTPSTPATVKIQYGHLITQVSAQPPLIKSTTSVLPETQSLYNDDLKFPSIPRDRTTVDLADVSHEYDPAFFKDIGMVPKKLHDYLFPNVPCNSGATVNELLDALDLPELVGDVRKKGLMAHFDTLGQEQFQSYEQLLLEAQAITKPPKMPTHWAFVPGWTRYDPTTGEPFPVEYPPENVLFFDVEVIVKESLLACLAVAMSPTAWYSWCSDRLVNDSPVPELNRLEHLVPLEPAGGSRECKMVIGHNVGFDRARVREQYLREKSGTRFWDTMSMNIAISGMADHQRSVYEKSDLTNEVGNKWIEAWRSRVSKNGLGAVHAKLCGDSTKLVLDKSMQNVFVKEDIDTIRQHFQELTNYCAQDVLATFEVFQKLYPMFRERFPHPVTSVGMLEMATTYLPITDNWRHFYAKCNEDATERNNRVARAFARAAVDVAESLAEGNAFESDPWMWISDWKVHAATKKPEWLLNLFSSRMSANKDPSCVVAGDVKLRGRDVPRVYGICYGPFPVFHKTEYGWGYLVPDDKRSASYEEYESVKTRRGDTIRMPNKIILDLIAKNRALCKPEIPLVEHPAAQAGIFNFYRLPHTEKDANVGSVFSKSFISDFERGILWASRHEDALADFLGAFRETRFWGNYRDRFKEEITVWLDDEAKVGAIAPAVVPAGTITRRATHKLWLTSTSHKDGVIGTDLKSMVQCTDGWKLVGADVDSQEQWLAALLGDVVCGRGRAGATPFANMLLAGSKADNSDLHSVVARQVGISRNHAKVLNYARLYGAGKQHAAEFLQQQGIPEAQANSYTNKLFSTTKGNVNFYHELNPELHEDFKEFLATACDEEFAHQHIFIDGRLFLPVYQHVDGHVTLLFEDWYKKKVCHLSETNKITNILVSLVKMFPNYPNIVVLHKGGFESHTFNFLELTARDACPRTPVLGCRLSKALEALPPGVPDADRFQLRYKRTVINWIIQSTAVDFLHMLIVCMKWLCEKYDINARFVISIHDEIRYLVTEEDQYRCALALSLSNMIVRAAISQKMGINELPMSIAFFSQVDIDSVLRKEVDIACITPDGRKVPPGTALDMAKILQETGARLSK